MRYGIVLVLIASVQVPHPVRAESPDPFEAKVRALASSRYNEREKATRELEAVGEPALNALNAAMKSTDSELRTRAEAIAGRIERAVLSKQLLTAPKLRIKLDNVPLNKAIADVATQTGLRFAFHPEKDTNIQRSISLDTGEVPYWQAVQAFFDAAGIGETDVPPNQGREQPKSKSEEAVRVQAFSKFGQRGGGPDPLIQLVPKHGSSNAFVGQALRIRPIDVGHASNKYDPSTGEVTFSLDVDAAKGIELREVLGVEVRKAVDDKGRMLASAYPVPTWQPNMYGDEMMVMRQVILANGEVLVEDGMQSTPFISVSLKAGANRPRILAELHGSLMARIVAPPQPVVVVEDVFKAKGKSHSKDGITLTVLSADEGGASNVATVKVSLVTSGEVINEFLNFPVQVKGRARPFLRINRRGTVAPGSPSEFQFVDATGAVLKIIGTRVNASSSDGVTMTQELELKVQKPETGFQRSSLSLNARRPAVVEMPFVLKNVQLP